MAYGVRYFYHCGSPWSDADTTLLTSDVSDPLDWENETALFDSEEDALRFMDEAYASLMGYHHDWQAVELRVVEVAA